jgi:hypothetical protein
VLRVPLTQPAAIARAISHGERSVAMACKRARTAAEVAIPCGKSRDSSVNESFSKPLEFSENSRRIRFE